MLNVRSSVTALLAAATVLGAAGPAAAYPHHYYPRYRGYHHHGGSTAGALIGGLLIGGAVAAVATSAENNRDQVNEVYDAPPPPPPPPAGEPVADTQGMAVDMCSEAAEHDSSPNAHVNAITRVERSDRAAPGWRVDGVVDTGRTRMDGYREIGQFTCAVEEGRVVDLRFGSGDGSPVAMR